MAELVRILGVVLIGIWTTIIVAKMIRDWWRDDRLLLELIKDANERIKHLNELLLVKDLASDGPPLAKAVAIKNLTEGWKLREADEGPQEQPPVEAKREGVTVTGEF